MRSFIPFAQPLFDHEEKEEVAAALDSGWVTLGPKTKQFEEDFAKYIDINYAVAVTSCTAALHLALIVAGIGEGDEVITTPFTFAATSNTIMQVGAKPVFVDIERDTYNIDPDKIEDAITSKTKAILPVHYAGHPVDLEKISKIALKHHLAIIEDAAHAVGTEYKGVKIGSHGHLTCFSFHPIKNMTTGDGGMVTTKNMHFAERLSQLRLHGMSKDAWKRHTASGSWKYDILEPGFKYNMTDISAALGIVQLRKLDDFIRIRTEYAHEYCSLFADTPEIRIPQERKNIRHSWNLYTIEVDTSGLDCTRDDMIEELKEKGIGANVYFTPLHHFTAFKKIGYKPGDFPVADLVGERIISLPLYPKMTQEEVVYVAQTLKEIITSHRK